VSHSSYVGSRMILRTNVYLENNDTEQHLVQHESTSWLVPIWAQPATTMQCANCRIS